MFPPPQQGPPMGGGGGMPPMMPPPVGPPGPANVNMMPGDPMAASKAGSPLLQALVAQQSPGMMPGGDTALGGLGPQDPNMGLMQLLEMLALAQSGAGPDM
jgi:hypothetical protein